ncbi:hypothetical protein CASFOL_032614 [Castilleja foliolosa]|uniref:Dirigent protein n=1 Tax=Castilleja foliolosa TaxID=1961234 RepID=A0ABD3C1Z8_9LAMI
MASISIFTNIILLMIIISSSTLISPLQFSKNDFGLTPKTTTFRFYFYDKLSSPNATAIRIVTGPTTSNTFFGSVVMIDDALLENESMGSKIIGRAQGLYAGADQTTVGLLMVVNYVFTAGEFNGSSLSVLGRNAVLRPVRELPILGGTGAFRLAQGYALASTKWIDNNTGDAIVEYNVTVYHYDINV